MANLDSSEPDFAYDIRLTATQKIWSCATGMLALFLIFSPLRSNLFLPIVVLSGAAGGTAFVWRTEKETELLVQQQKLKQMEQRLRNLEAIASINETDLQRYLRAIESNSPIR